MPTLKRDEIDRLVKAHFEDRMRDINELLYCFAQDDAVDLEDEADGAEQREAELRQAAAERKYGPGTRQIAKDVAANAGYPDLGPSQEQFDWLCDGVVRAEVEAYRIFQANLRGRFEDTRPIDPLFTGADYRQMPPLPGDGDEQSRPTVKLISLRYVQQKSKHDWVQKTINENKRVLAWFRELVGSEKDIKAVTADDVRMFRDAMLDLPTNFSKAAPYKGKTLKQVLDLGTNEKKIAKKTAQKYLLNLKSFLNWCVDEGYLPQTPAEKSRSN
jgi:DNA-binding ferritin-like protein (Dps family)